MLVNTCWPALATISHHSLDILVDDLPTHQSLCRSQQSGAYKWTINCHTYRPTVSAESQSIHQPTLSLFGQQIGWYVGRYVSMTGYDMSVDMSIWHDMSINILLVWINRLFYATDLGFNKLSSDQKPSSVRLTYSVNRTQFVQFVGNRPCVKPVLGLTYVLGVTMLGVSNWRRVKDRPQFAGCTDQWSTEYWHNDQELPDWKLIVGRCSDWL